MMATLVIERATGTPAPEERCYRPYGAAEQILYCHAPEALIDGPSGTGKSRASLEKLHLCGLKYPRMRGLIVRKTRESLTQSALVTFDEKVLPPNWAERMFRHEPQEYQYPNGSTIAVGGMDKISKIMSSEYDIIFVQEATELMEADWEALTTRLRNGVMPYQQIVGDCNPDNPDHWLMQRVQRGIVTRFQSRHEDNPTCTAEYLRQLDKLTGVRYKRLRLGLWVASEGMYFEEWSPEVHICKPFDIPPDWTRWLAVDYGFAAPFCCLWFARSPERRIFLYRELYATGLRDEQQADLIKARSAGERIVRCVGDPSMFNARSEQQKPSIAQVYQTHGVPLTAGQNNRIAGWQTVRRALAWTPDVRPRLQVLDGRCPNLVRTLPAMVRDPLDAEDLADKIRNDATEDHVCDALRYGLMAEAAPERKLREREFAVEGG